MSKITTDKSKDAIMHPMGLIILALVLQVLVFFAGYVFLRNYVEVAAVALRVLAFVLVIFIINRPQNPAYKIAWIVIICVLPIFGVLLYLLIQLVPGTRAAAVRLERRVAKTAPFLPQNNAALARLREKDTRVASFCDYLYHEGPYPVYERTVPTYYPLGDDGFPAMMEDMAQAKKYIFLEYFIVSEGQLWDEMFALLKRKAAEGVTVRFLYDGTNMFSLPRDFQQRILDAGIDCRIFAPVRPFLSTYQNNRNHRKVMVIDGKVAYTGGINLADEYINAIERFGHWKDTVIRIEGDAVQTMTALFLHSWHAHNEDPQDYARWLENGGLPCGDSGERWVVPYADAPEDGTVLAEAVYLQALNLATDYVHIMTPYLILDHETQQALIFAARRGVDVTLLLPHIPDKKIPFSIARSYYPVLIKNGVHIVEYTPGFVHAKVLVSDDRIASVGTVNLDYRSLYLHFENGIWLYDEAFAKTVEADFQDCVAQGQRMTLRDYEKTSLFHRLTGRVMRIFGPLM